MNYCFIFVFFKLLKYDLTKTFEKIIILYSIAYIIRVYFLKTICMQKDENAFCISKNYVKQILTELILFYEVT